MSSLLIDPSLLVSERAFDAVVESASLAEPGSLFVPRTFHELAASGELPYVEPVAGFFGASSDVTFLHMVREAISFLPLAPYPSQDAVLLRAEVRYPEIRVADPVLLAILREEWAFLQSMSWIASRVRRPFSAFLRGGAAAVELPVSVLDRAAAKTLKLHEDVPVPLRPGQRLRAASKWVAASGTVGAIEAFVPGLGWPADAIAGMFLLFDP